MDWFSIALPSTTYLEAHGSWRGTEAHPVNSWLDFDSVDEFWVGGSIFGPDLLRVVWASFFFVTPESEWNDVEWHRGLLYLAVTGDDEAKYLLGLYCRIDVLMRQLFAAKCIVDILNLRERTLGGTI